MVQNIIILYTLKFATLSVSMNIFEYIELVRLFNGTIARAHSF